jgi:hypothetical protein
MGSIENMYEKKGYLKAVFRKAFEICDTAKPSESNDEYIAMIAEGRINEIPEPERSKILDVIAADPESAMLLKDLSDAGICSSVAARQTGTVRKLAVAWATAACIMIGLFTWKAMDTTFTTGHHHSTTPYSMQQDNPDYWSQLEKQRLSSSQLRSRCRDYALILSTSATLVLAALVAVGFLRNSKKDD